MFSGLFISGCSLNPLRYEGYSAKEWYSFYDDAEAELYTYKTKYQNVSDELLILDECLINSLDSIRKIVRDCVETEKQEILSSEGQWKWSQEANDWTPNTYICDQIALKLAESLEKEERNCLQEYQANRL